MERESNQRFENSLSEEEITKGRFVRHGLVLAADISQINIFALKPSPVKLSKALHFLIEPETTPVKTWIAGDPNQTTLFSESSLDILTFYEWINRADSTLENVLTKLKNDFPNEFDKYSKISTDYFQKVVPLGKKDDFSGKPYSLRIKALQKNLDLEDKAEEERSIALIGKMDEVRIGNNPSIIRIKQTPGRPGANDAIRLTLDLLAYLARSKRIGTPLVYPDLKLFNLINGKMYVADLETGKIANETISALNYSDLSMKAGFVPEGIKSDIATIDQKTVEMANERAKKVIVRYKKGKRKQILTAKEAFERGQNRIKRIRGELPKTNRLYYFAEIE